MRRSALSSRTCEESHPYPSYADEKALPPASITKWSKSFLEAGKNGLTRDTLRDATSDEVKKLGQENEQLEQSLAQAILEAQRYRGSFGL